MTALHTTAPRPRVLVIAYACEPGRGSEPGAGWGVVSALGGFADGVVLVGPEHAPALEGWTAAHPTSGLTFVTVPERRWPAVAGRGRIGWFLSYLRWLPAAHATATALHASQPFDLAWHVTYSVYWLPSPVHRLGLPSVWGPVGGAVTTPRTLWPLLGVRGMATELVDLLAVRLLSALPAVRRTWRQVSVRLVQNPETLARIGTARDDATHLMNHALFVESPRSAPRQRTRELVIACALESRKGVELVLRALVHTAPDVHLTIAGDGPQRAHLESLAAALRISDRVTFAGVLPRAELQHRFAMAAGAVFTGLREEGGLALAEAMMAGTPVIVLGVGGAAWIAQQALDPARVTIVAVAGVEDTARRLGAAMARAVAHPSTASTPLLDRDAAVSMLQQAVRQALATAAVPRDMPAPALTQTTFVSTDTVTVVIPVFNGARFLEAAVRSVLAQSHALVRVVVVDDGSTDATGAIAIRLAAGDARVRVVSIPNGGRALARNVGVASVPPAPFIAFLDGDDLWDADKLARQLQVFAAHPEALGVGSRMRYISSSNDVLGETGQEVGAADLRAIARGELAPFPISSCLVVRREAFERLQGFDEELREAEDLDFLARLARAGRIIGMPDALGAYRIHPDSAMATARARVNMFARFVRQRLAARDAGGDLRWSDFAAAYDPSWLERRRDAVETWYRSAALWKGEGDTLRAAGYAMLAGLAAPVYTLRRMNRQRLVRHAGR